jgi:PAS domain-containing protein
MADEPGAARRKAARIWRTGCAGLDLGWEKTLAYCGWLIHSASGETFAFLSTTDVTERKRATLQLAESESRRLAEMSAALEVQQQSSRAALSLMEDALASQKQAEESEATLRKLSLAIEQSSESIVITTLDGAIEYVNDAFLQISGYSREELIGKNPRVLQSGQTPAANLHRDVGRPDAGAGMEGRIHQPQEGRHALRRIRHHHAAAPARRDESATMWR